MMKHTRIFSLSVLLILAIGLLLACQPIIIEVIEPTPMVVSETRPVIDTEATPTPPAATQVPEEAQPTEVQPTAGDMELTLLSDPFLQLPTADSVQVVWFTAFEGTGHTLSYGADLEQEATAETTKLSRAFEDQDSQVAGFAFSEVTARDIWRHEAIATGLTPGQRVPYYVASQSDDGQTVQSEQFTLAPLPEAGQPLQILLTSDHQLEPLVAANLEKVVQTVGQVDAVFFAGDMVNVPDRASEWFDDLGGTAFFPNLQGKARASLSLWTSAAYRGGEIIQSAPLFPAVGNHEVMGRFGRGDDLTAQFNDPQPRRVAEAASADAATGDNREQWIEDHSFNTITYNEIFSLPQDSPGSESYYAIQYGDVYLITLAAARVWRSPTLNEQARGTYHEATADLSDPDQWGYGQFIFTDIAAGSEQYDWLVGQLASPEFQAAPYKVVMLHHPPHSLGENVVPAFVEPEPVIEQAADGTVSAVRYEYPQAQDILVNDILPLLDEAGVNLVLAGHAHVWDRFQTDSGLNLLESSNVGASYGCFTAAGQSQRWAAETVANDADYNAADYAPRGDPNGLEPVSPSILAPLNDAAGQPLPCVASNQLTVFSILNTASGQVESYYFDPSRPASEAVKFDAFDLK